MADTLRITKGQSFALFIPLVILNADGSKEEVVASSLRNASVSVSSVHGEFDPTCESHEQYLVLRIPATLKTGDYAVVVTANLPNGRTFSLRLKRAFSIVDWDFQSNWKDYLVGDRIELTDQPFIAGTFSTDAEYEALKGELAVKIAEAEAEKAEWQRRLSNISGLATKTDVDNAKQDILDGIGSIDPYVKLTDEDFNEVMAEEEQEPVVTLAAAPQVDNRPRIEAYNANLDVRVQLRRIEVVGDMAIWEDVEQNHWYTDYPYAIGYSVRSNNAPSVAWGIISLISE